MHKPSPLRRFLSYVKPYRGLVAGAAFMGILKFCLPLLFPLALKFITDDILVGQTQEAYQPDATSRFFQWCATYLNAWLPFLGAGKMGLLNALALSLLLVYIVLIRFMSPRIKKASRSAQEKLEEMSGDLQEKIGGMSVIKAFHQERREARRFFQVSHKLFDFFKDNVYLNSWNQAFSGFLTTVAPLIVVWIASIFVLRAQMTVGTIIAFYSFLGSLYLPLQRFSELGLIVSNSLAAIERLFEYFDVQPQILESPQARTLPTVRGDLRFARVNFAYDNQLPALSEIDFDIRAGEMVALVGASGSGKSTLVSLIPRFYDVTSGRVLIDGHDIREVTFKSLRWQIGIVLQDSILFSTTLRENLLYGRPQASAAEILTAAEAANAMEFIQILPESLDTVIGERGLKLSGGQRQRVAIARAFLKNPAILILDEATSSLDSESEHLIQEALARLMRGRTTIVIAHRLSTVVEADKIIVLQNGHVVEIGRHEELLRHGGHYAFLARRQFRDTMAPLRAVAA